MSETPDSWEDVIKMQFLIPSRQGLEEIRANSLFYLPSKWENSLQRQASCIVRYPRKESLGKRLGDGFHWIWQKQALMQRAGLVLEHFQLGFPAWGSPTLQWQVICLICWLVELVQSRHWRTKKKISLCDLDSVSLIQLSICFCFNSAHLFFQLHHTIGLWLACGPLKYPDPVLQIHPRFPTLNVCPNTPYVTIFCGWTPLVPSA